MAVGETLNAVVDMFKNQEIEDAFIVPVSISYEKLPDEHMLEYSQIESIHHKHNTVTTLWKLLTGSFGYIRVDLSQPFRLRVRLVLLILIYSF